MDVRIGGDLEEGCCRVSAASWFEIDWIMDYIISTCSTWKV